jgi:hypothetical protein
MFNPDGWITESSAREESKSKHDFRAALMGDENEPAT